MWVTVYYMHFLCTGTDVQDLLKLTDYTTTTINKKTKEAGAITCGSADGRIWTGLIKPIHHLGDAKRMKYAGIIWHTDIIKSCYLYEFVSSNAINYNKMSMGVSRM